jgi:hypothetical protein
MLAVMTADTEVARGHRRDRAKIRNDPLIVRSQQEREHG